MRKAEPRLHRPWEDLFEICSACREGPQGNSSQGHLDAFRRTEMRFQREKVAAGKTGNDQRLKGEVVPVVEVERVNGRWMSQLLVATTKYVG